MQRETSRAADERGQDRSAGLDATVVGSAVVTYAAQALRLVIQFGSVVLLSRLLMPSDFGLLAMVTPIYGLVLLVQDLGLTQATIQRARVTPVEMTALFWVNTAAGAGFAAALLLVSPFVVRLYGDNRAGQLASAYAAIVLINGIAAQHLALLNREMRFRYLAALDTVAFALGTSASVLLALIRPTYWALFAGPLVIALITAIGAWTHAGFRPGPPRRQAGMADLLGFGAGITVTNVCNFVARNIDNVLIGSISGGLALGLYDRAYKLLLLPLQQINQPLARVMMPTLSRLQHDPVRYRATYLRALETILTVTQPGVVFALATADILVPMLLGETWRGAVPIFEWLGLAALQQSATATATWLFISQGRSGAYMKWGLINAGSTVVAVIAGLPWGPTGVAAAFAISQWGVRLPVISWMSTRRGPVRLQDLCRTVVPHASASLAAYVAASTLHRTVALEAPLALAATFIASYVVAAIVLSCTDQGRTTLFTGWQVVCAVAGPRLAGMPWRSS